VILSRTLLLRLTLRAPFLSKIMLLMLLGGKRQIPHYLEKKIIYLYWP
jgi:hypothetical protein